MPSAYANVMRLASRSGLSGEELHRTVMDNILSYKSNYDMTFPELNYIPMLIEYTKELCLPRMCIPPHRLGFDMANLRAAETIVVARRLASSLGLVFCFPTTKSRIYALDNPEVQIVSVLAVAAKMCFPFEISRLSLLDLTGCLLPSFSWETWKSIFPREGSNLDQGAQEQNGFDNLTPNQITSMTDEDFDAYMTHLSASIDHSNSESAKQNPYGCTGLVLMNTFTDEDAVAQFFPPEAQHAPPSPKMDASEGDVEERARHVLAQSVEQRDGGKDGAISGKQGEMMYEAFRTVEDLSPISYAFYKAAGWFIPIDHPVFIAHLLTCSQVMFLGCQLTP